MGNSMKFIIDAGQDAAIRAIPRFGTSEYGSIDIARTLEFMYKRYVVPLSASADLTCSTLCDCGAGFGWLSFSYLLAGGRKAILCEYEYQRLAAAKAIARVLGVQAKCEFICCSLHRIPLADCAIDIFASVETLEHVGKDRISHSVTEIARVARATVLLSSPNQYFPYDMHDTRLPLTHWLPGWIKPWYARLWGRDRTFFNAFPTPRQMRELHRTFRPASRCYGFVSYAAWLQHYPHYNPYDKVTRDAPSRVLSVTLSIASKLLSRYSFIVAPNLCSIWVRNECGPRSPNRPKR